MNEYIYRIRLLNLVHPIKILINDLIYEIHLIILK